MSIITTIEEACEEMCLQYCKWPLLWDEEKEGIELMDSDVCANCPLNKLN